MTSTRTHRRSLRNHEKRVLLSAPRTKYTRDRVFTRPVAMTRDVDLSTDNPLPVSSSSALIVAALKNQRIFQSLASWDTFLQKIFPENEKKGGEC